MGSLSVREVIQELYISLTALVFNFAFWLMLELSGFRRGRSRRAFCNVNLSLLAVNALSCIVTVLRQSDLYAPPVYVSALQSGVYFLNAMLTYSFSVYVVRFYSRQDGTEHRIPRINKGMLILQAILLLSWYVYAAPQMVRTKEYLPMRSVLFFIIGFFMNLYHLGYCVVFMMTNHNRLRRRSRNVIIAGLVLTISTIVMQAFIGSVPLVNYLGGTVGLLVFFFAAEMPDLMKGIAVDTAVDQAVDTAADPVTETPKDMDPEIHTPSAFSEPAKEILPTAVTHLEPQGDLPEIEDGLSKEEAIRRVEAAAPEILASYRDMARILQPYFEREDRTFTADKPRMAAEELRELYEAIGELSEVYDSDGIGNLLAQLDGYTVPEEDLQRVKTIRDCAARSDWSALRDVLSRKENSNKEPADVVS